MKKRLNNKGFTLIELLVAMTILSIITAMSIPLLRNATNNGTNRKYSTFKDNVIYASKLYVDSYEEDLFDNRDSGCAYIDVESLIDRKLAKDINIDNTSCKTSESYVQVVKAGNKYTYTPYITCGTINNDGSVGDNGYTYPSGKHVKDENACGFEADFNMNISPTISQTEESSKKKNIKLNVNSYTGFNPNIQMYYGFTAAEGSTVPTSSWQRVSFTVPSIKDQKKIIQAGTSPSGISITSDDIYTPDGINGDIYLIVRVDNMIDLYGESWTRTGDRIIVYGPYKIDNTAPVVNDLKITKENDKWKYTANIVDHVNYENYYSICPNAINENYCTENSDYTINYNAFNDIDSYIRSYYSASSGRLYSELCVKVMDFAGNKSSISCSQSSTYNIRMYANDGTNDYEVRSLVYTDKQDKKTYSEITSSRPNKTRNGYTFKHWSTTTSGAAVDSNSYYTGEASSLYAVWQLNEYNITLKNVDNKGAIQRTTYNVQTPKTLPNPEVDGYTFTGWTAPNIGSPNRNYKIPTGTTGDLEFFANFSANSYTITLTGLAGSNITKTYTTNDEVTIDNPTKSGYTFTGWTGSGITTPTKNLKLPRYTYGNKTYTANWSRN